VAPSGSFTFRANPGNRDKPCALPPRAGENLAPRSASVAWQNFCEEKSGLFAESQLRRNSSFVSTESSQSFKRKEANYQVEAPKDAAVSERFLLTTKVAPSGEEFLMTTQTMMQQCESLKAEVEQRCQSLSNFIEHKKQGLSSKSSKSSSKSSDAERVLEFMGPSTRQTSNGSASTYMKAIHQSAPEARSPDAASLFPKQCTPTVSEDGSNDTCAKPPSAGRSSPHCESYTEEQWKAFHELEQAEMLCEFRRMEMALAEERSRSAQLQKIFAMELMAQKDAHARDVASLEDMVSKVLTENRRLSTMVEHLCGEVPQAFSKLKEDIQVMCTSQVTAAPVKISKSGGSRKSTNSSRSEKSTTSDSKGSSEEDASTVSEHQLSTSSDDMLTTSRSVAYIYAD
jgi:hypothetical protein